MEKDALIIYAETADELVTEINKKKTNRLFLRGITFMILLIMVIYSIPVVTSVYADPAAETTPERLYEAEKVFYLYQQHANGIVDDEKKMDLIDVLPSPVYHSESNYYLYSGTYAQWQLPARKAWAHARSLYYQGLIHGSSFGTQCTFFAQMWFYDIYGFNSSGNGATGNGKNFASTVYQVNTYYDENGILKHWFEYGKGPQTMGIVSVSYPSNEAGHVICVDEVDYLNGMITISDGNITNNGDVRIRQTMTLSRFYSLYPGHYTFVNPTKELLETMKQG